MEEKAGMKRDEGVISGKELTIIVLEGQVTFKKWDKKYLPKFLRCEEDSII